MGIKLLETCLRVGDIVKHVPHDTPPALDLAKLARLEPPGAVLRFFGGEAATKRVGDLRCGQTRAVASSGGGIDLARGRIGVDERSRRAEGDATDRRFNLQCSLVED